MEVGLMHCLCWRMLYKVQYSTDVSVVHSPSRPWLFLCTNWKTCKKREREFMEITRNNSKLAWKLDTIIKGKYQQCFSVSGKTTWVIVLRKEYKMKSSWMLHNINRILGAIQSSARSVHIYKFSECKFAEDFLFNSTSVKVSDLARNKILWREYIWLRSVM